ncbi:NUDIX hydrolase [Hyunsoonleella ulvae]|uniref:NUDIX hydrolase n=1 Tax=Hyunsoonleella ulvae TaxID=2799948 RepID=UPI0019399DA3|nr:NUDIX hydrolase [Hyunsoonleella ulvae]
MKRIDKSRLLAYNGDKLLVLEKVGRKKRYSLAGGIKKKKESDLEALIRETFEEININLNKKKLTYFISKKRINKYNIEVNRHYFVAPLKSGKIKILEDHKFKVASWVYWYDALDHLDKDDRFVVELYFGQFNKKIN